MCASNGLKIPQPATQVVAAWRKTGCPNQTPGADPNQYWGRISDSAAWDDMYLYCDHDKFSFLIWTDDGAADMYLYCRYRCCMAR